MRAQAERTGKYIDKDIYTGIGRNMQTDRPTIYRQRYMETKDTWRQRIYGLGSVDFARVKPGDDKKIMLLGPSLYFSKSLQAIQSLVVFPSLYFSKSLQAIESLVIFPSLYFPESLQAIWSLVVFP